MLVMGWSSVAHWVWVGMSLRILVSVSIDVYE